MKNEISDKKDHNYVDVDERKRINGPYIKKSRKVRVEKTS